MPKRQVCFQLEEEQAKEMESIRDETGLPLSRQIELDIKGYKIVKIKDIEKRFKEVYDEISELKSRLSNVEVHPIN